MKLASRTSLWRQQVVDVLVVDLELETKQQKTVKEHSVVYEIMR